MVVRRRVREGREGYDDAEVMGAAEGEVSGGVTEVVRLRIREVGGCVATTVGERHRRGDVRGGVRDGR